jgi:hypothetical protein
MTRSGRELAGVEVSSVIGGFPVGRLTVTGAQAERKRPNRIGKMFFSFIERIILDNYYVNTGRRRDN